MTVKHTDGVPLKLVWNALCTYTKTRDNIHVIRCTTDRLPSFEFIQHGMLARLYYTDWLSDLSGHSFITKDDTRLRSLNVPRGARNMVYDFINSLGLLAFGFNKNNLHTQLLKLKAKYVIVELPDKNGFAITRDYTIAVCCTRQIIHALANCGKEVILLVRSTKRVFIDYSLSGFCRSSTSKIVELVKKDPFVEYVYANLPGRKRRNFSKGVRYRVFVRDGSKCVICGASPNTNKDVQLCVDHIIPVSKGGTNNPKNLRTLCWDCNAGKAAKLPPLEHVKHSKKLKLQLKKLQHDTAKSEKLCKHKTKMKKLQKSNKLNNRKHMQDAIA